MRTANIALIPILALTIVIGVTFGERTAATQSAPPLSTDTRDDGGRAQASGLTRTRMARLSRAQRNVDHLARKLYDARQEVLALQSNNDSAAKHNVSSPVPVTKVAIVSDAAVLTRDASTAGFETNDSVAFVYRDANGAQVITGTGIVNHVYPNDLELEIIGISKAVSVSPEDEVYVINRGDSPHSLVKLFK